MSWKTKSQAGATEVHGTCHMPEGWAEERSMCYACHACAHATGAGLVSNQRLSGESE